MRPVSRLSFVSLAVTVIALLHAGAGLGRASANTLYVKTGGDDSALCTATAPCRTVNHAVSVAQSGDTIQLGVGTFSENDGVQVPKDLTIQGSFWLGTKVTLGWVTNACNSVFSVSPGVNVRLAAMTISGATFAGSCSAAGVLNQGTLTVTGVAITGNHAPGVRNDAGASLTMRNVAVDRNERVGVSNGGTADLFDVQITGTSSSEAGDISGVGIDNRGTLTIDRGLISGNKGSGVYASSRTGTGPCPTTTSLMNATITGNSGNGIWAQCGALKLEEVTLAKNSATAGGGLRALFHDLGDFVWIVDSIVAKNTPGPQCLFTADAPAIVSVSVSHSLTGDNSCLAWPGPASGNLIGVDPLLGGLTYKGPTGTAGLFAIGATRVLLLLAGSPAIDTASETFGVPYDQVGTPRPQDGDGNGEARYDMGAYEYRPATAGSDTR